MKHQLTILVIAHDTQRLPETLEVLRRAGYATLHAFTAESGLALARTACPAALLLCDAPTDMPIPEICRAVRADALLCEMFIAFLCSPDVSENTIHDIEPHIDAILLRSTPERILSAQFKTLMRANMTHAARRSDQERLLLAADAVNEGIWDLNYEHDAPQFFWNPQYYTMLGYEPGEFAPSFERWKMLLHPDDFPAAYQKLVHCLDNMSNDYEHEARFLTKMRDWKWLLIKGRVIKRDHAGRLLRMIGTHADITARKQMEDALRKSEQRLSFALEGTSDALWDWDVPTGTTYFSPRYYTMLGYEPDEFPSDYDHWRERLHPDDLRPSEEALVAHFAGDAPGYAIEFRMKTKQGGWRWILGRGKAMERDAAGRAIRMTGTHTDITERKEAEAEIRRLNAELEERVRQRTAALEAANKELQAFAYVVSHDLKTPLRGISQIAYWLASDYAHAFDAEGQELLAMMIARVKRMDSLIDGILAYSRIGRAESANEPVNLHDALEEARELLPSSEGISMSVDTDLPTVIGDAVRLTQVFHNLLSNAIKFMDKPDGRIRVGCLSDGDFWRCYVADNGPGIDPKYHDRIFRIFQTLAPRDDHESTGIGLAVAQKIIEFYGGKIWVESEPGTGSTFFFTLPKQAGTSEKEEGDSCQAR